LPEDHKERNRLVEDRLNDGDTLAVAAVVRDLAERERQRGELTIVSKRLLDRGMALLAGEVAAAKGIDRERAELIIRERLRPEAAASVPA
jgi:RNA polymerase-interacting CarD/CdnL/TRCF family regulator